MTRNIIAAALTALLLAACGGGGSDAPEDTTIAPQCIVMDADPVRTGQMEAQCMETLNVGRSDGSP